MLVRIVICSLLLLASSCKPKPVQEERAPLDLANPSPQDVVSQGDAVGTAKVTAQAKGDVVATAPDVRTKTQDVAELAGDAGQKVAVQQPPVDMDQLAKKIQWTLVPKELEVMRNTPVKLGMSWAQAPGGEVVCEWDPGDRTGLLNGCNVDHVFVGGLSDRTVSLRVLVDGKEVLKENRLLPIERLPVQSNPDKDYQLPPPPGEGAGVRVLLASTYSEVTPESTAALVQALTVSKAVW